MCAELAHEHALEDLHKITDHTTEENPARGMPSDLPADLFPRELVYILLFDWCFIRFGPRKDADFAVYRSRLLGELPRSVDADRAS